MTIAVQEVTDRRGLKAFVRFPYDLYAGNSCWVPPLLWAEMNTLRRDRNPAFDFCEAKYWLAYRDGSVVGRIAGIINHRYVEKWGNRYARFGWVDFIDDRDVSAAMLGVVEEWARSKGMQGVHGPLGFTDLDREGMLVEGFDELGTLATIYNHAYYPAHLEANGYRKDVDWVEYEITALRETFEKVGRIGEIAARRGGLKVVRFARRKDILPYAREMFAVLNQAYEGLYGVVSLTEKQIDDYMAQYLGLVRPEYVSLVTDADGRIAAFGVTLPSLSRALQKSRGRLLPFGWFHLWRAMRKNDAVDLYLVAVRPELQGKGVNALLMYDLTKRYLADGIVRVETNPELENNARVQAQWKFFESRQHKRRRCYLKQLA